MFADCATTFERAGGVAYCVEQLAAAAEKAKEIAAEREAEREAAAASATGGGPMSAGAARAMVLGKGKDKGGGSNGGASDAVELLLQSDGVRDDLADATLGLEWTRLVEKPNGASAHALESRELSKALVHARTLRPVIQIMREGLLHCLVIHCCTASLAPTLHECSSPVTHASAPRDDSLLLHMLPHVDSDSPPPRLMPPPSAGLIRPRA